MTSHIVKRHRSSQPRTEGTKSFALCLPTMSDCSCHAEKLCRGGAVLNGRLNPLSHPIITAPLQPHRTLLGTNAQLELILELQIGSS